MPLDPLQATPADAQHKVDPIGFLLLPQFPIYALILALESLRVANQNAGRRLFGAHLFSVDGAPVAAGNGMSMAPERAIADVPFFPTVIVCAGNVQVSSFVRIVAAVSLRPEGAAFSSVSRFSRSSHVDSPAGAAASWMRLNRSDANPNRTRNFVPSAS